MVRQISKIKTSLKKPHPKRFVKQRWISFTADEIAGFEQIAAANHLTFSNVVRLLLSLPALQVGRPAKKKLITVDNERDSVSQSES